MKERHECDVLLDYFNSTLTETEQAEFEKHLETCSDCQAELLELRMLTEDLPYLAEATEPNGGMKERILTAVFSETDAKERIEQKPVEESRTSRKPKQWLQPLLAASLLLSLGANAYFFLNEKPKVTEPMTASVIQDVQLAATEGFRGSAQATMVNEKHAASLIVQAEQLQKLSGTETYQVWLIDEKGDKVRAGTFRPNESGNGAVSHPMPESKNRSWKMIAVTLEPTPESAQPLGDIVLAAEL